MAKSAVPDRYTVTLDSGEKVTVELTKKADKPWKLTAHVPSRGDAPVEVEFPTDTAAKEQAVAVAGLLDQARAKRAEALALEEQAVIAMTAAAAKPKP